MIIKGSYKDVDGKLVKLTINNKTRQKDTIDIDVSKDIYFTDNPILIKNNFNDIFKTIIKKSCEVNFITKKYLGDIFFSDNARSCTIRIEKEDNIIFDGFVEPCTFNQSYSDVFDNITLHCTDCLSVLHYQKYRNVTADNHKKLKANADNISFLNLIKNAFKDFDGSIYYDCSKGATNDRLMTVFDDLMINEAFLFSSSYDKTFNQEQIIDEMLKYLNLKIIQEGKDFFIFDLMSLGSDITWVNILTKKLMVKKSNLITLKGEDHADNSTSITILQPFNQIKLKCSIEEMKNVLSSPLEKRNIKSFFGNKVKYCTTYFAEGEGKDAYRAFFDMIKNTSQNNDFDGASFVDYYCQPIYNENWQFFLSDGTNTNDIVEFENKEAVYPYKIPYTINKKPLSAGLLRFGKSREIKKQDNSPISSVSLSDYLYISINGNNKTKGNEAYPNDSTLNSITSLANYTGSSSGIYSPSDNTTTNYILFKGTFYLQSNEEAFETDHIDNLISGQFSGDEDTIANKFLHPNDYGFNPHFWHNTVKSVNNKDGRYLTRRYYKNRSVNDKIDTNLKDTSIVPIDEGPNKDFEYSYNSDGKVIDTISYCPILVCYLQIGNKILVEKEPQKYAWVDVKSGYIKDGQKINYFTLGVDPYIGNHLIGQTLKIANNVTIPTNLNEEGTAIPINQSDNLSGKLTFKILSVCNLAWDNVKRRHSTWFRHSKYSENNELVLPKLKGIFIKDFEAKIVSDNGGLESLENKDLIYLSNEKHTYINKNEGTTFKFITALDSKEAFVKGISPKLPLNAVLRSDTKTPIRSIYNNITKEQAKAEEHFVDEYYRLTSIPKVKMLTNLKDKTGIEFINKYHSNTLNKDFVVLSINKNITNNTSKVLLLEK